MSNIYEDLEDIAGHKLTMVAPILCGVTTYYCENCGAIMKISSSGRVAGGTELVLFHVPPWSTSVRDNCQVPHQMTWRSKLEKVEGFVSLQKKLTLLMIDGFVTDTDTEDGVAAKLRERILSRDE